MESFFKLISSLFFGAVTCVIVTSYEFVFLGDKTYQNEFVFSVIVAGSLSIAMMTVGILATPTIPQKK